MRHLSDAMLAHLIIDLLVARVGFDANARRFQLCGHVMRIAIGLGCDRGDHGLDRCQPDGEAASIMFNQDTDEAFIAAENRAVQHDGAVARTIFADIACVQTLRQHAVGLNRAHLPRPANRVG